MDNEFEDFPPQPHIRKSRFQVTMIRNSIGLVIIWSSLLYSCHEVTFRQPQPSGVAALKEVPASLRGNYVGETREGENTDTLVITSWGYRISDPASRDWLGRGVINDSLVIKYYANYYFVNFRSGDQWVVRLVRQKPSGAIELLAINLEDELVRKQVLTKLGGQLKIKEIKQDEHTFYQINPNRDQLLRLIREGYFTGSELSRVK
jgi:hypothetical protein